jgi:hypothetical protein
VEHDEVVGVALVRVWIPVDTPDRLVIRVVATDAGNDQPIGVASTISDATAVLQAWLEGLVRHRNERIAAGAADAYGHARPGRGE